MHISNCQVNFFSQERLRQLSATIQAQCFIFICLCLAENKNGINHNHFKQVLQGYNQHTNQCPHNSYQPLSCSGNIDHWLLSVIQYELNIVKLLQYSP
jgi:hypothetical protein